MYDNLLPSLFDFGSWPVQCPTRSNGTKYMKSTYYSDVADENGRTISVDVPGIPRDNLEIQIDENRYGVQFLKLFNKNEQLLSIELRRNTDIEKIESTLDLGVLKITIPREAEKRTVKVIPIK